MRWSCEDLAGVGIELPSKVRKRSCCLSRLVIGLQVLHIQSTDKEMIHARKVTDAHAQDFMAHDSRYYKPWKHLYSANAPCTLLEVLVVFSLHLGTELPLFPICSSPLVPSSVNIPPHSGRHAHSVGITSFSEYSIVLFISLHLQQNTPECPCLLHWRCRTGTIPSFLLYKEWCLFHPDHAKMTASLVKTCSALSHLDGCVTGRYRSNYHKYQLRFHHSTTTREC